MACVWAAEAFTIARLAVPAWSARTWLALLPLPTPPRHALTPELLPTAQAEEQHGEEA